MKNSTKEALLDIFATLSVVSAFWCIAWFISGKIIEANPNHACNCTCHVEQK